ncbi:MAG: TaqI-like C-terminal specificity domain-containing protein, partial [Rhabdochlamydiaceae bacterium]
MGDDIRKYYINNKDRYLIWTYLGVPIKSFPAIFEHLEKFQPQLEARQDQGKHWWELRACSYYDKFDAPKIIYPDIAMSPRFTFDKEALYLDMTAFCIPGADFYLLSLLNSRLLFRVLSEFAPSLGDMNKGGRLRMKTVYVKKLPILKISFTTPKKEREKLTKSLIKQAGTVLGSIERETADEHIQRELQPVIALAKSYSESKNDILHDFLASLAEQMLAMNKEKQKLANDFFEWMGHYGVPPRETMKPKTGLDAFWKLEFKNLLAHLKRNKVAISTGTQDDLLARFTEASTALKILDKQIESTDWLIDQVVYALYGLTKEE